MPNIDRDATTFIGRVGQQGPHHYKRSFRHREDAEAWAIEIESLVRAGSAPDPNGLLVSQVAVDYSRQREFRWLESSDRAALSDVRRRFGRLACTTIVAADVAAWAHEVRDSRGDDDGAFECRLTLLSALCMHAQSKMRVHLPAGDPVSAWRRSQRSRVPVASPAHAAAVRSMPAAQAPASDDDVFGGLGDMGVFLKAGLDDLLGERQPGAPMHRRTQPRSGSQPVVVDVPSRVVGRPALGMGPPMVSTGAPMVVAGTVIRVDAQGRYCLNDLHRACGGEKRNQPSNFLHLQQTVDLAAVVENSIPGIPGIDRVRAIESRQRVGTFVSKPLVYAYAMWVSPDFHLAVILAYDALAGARPVAPADLREMHEVLSALPDRVAAAVAQAIPTRLLAAASGPAVLVNASTAAGLLGVSVSFLERNRRVDGGDRVPFLRLGARVLYAPDVLRNWVAEKSVAARGWKDAARHSGG